MFVRSCETCILSRSQCHIWQSSWSCIWRSIHLVKSKCIPVLLYGLEACVLNKEENRSIDFTTTRFFMKLFRTSNPQVIDDCQTFFGVESPSVRQAKLRCKFIARYKNNDNNMCKLFNTMWTINLLGQNYNSVLLNLVKILCNIIIFILCFAYVRCCCYHFVMK